MPPSSPGLPAISQALATPTSTQQLSGHSTSYLFNNLVSPARASNMIVFQDNHIYRPKTKTKNTHVDSGQGDSDWTRCPAHNKQENMQTTGGRSES